MMNKNEFLEALKRALAVLDEAELQDIIDEYEQHIDMKTANGLTEEEAIADFGDFKELTAELLEAYHVRADYAEVNRFQTESYGKGRAYQAQAGYSGTNGSKPKQAASEGKTAGQEGGSAPGGAERTGWLRNRKLNAADGGTGDSDQGFAAGLWKRISGACSGLWQGTKSAAGWLRRAAKQTGIRLWKALLWCWHQICRPFVWLAGLLGFGAGAASGGRTVPDGAEEPALSKEKKGGGRTMDRRSIWEVMGDGITAFCRGCVGACVWCIRMAWNAFCICTSVFVGILGIFFLFAFGMLAILVISGYPLGGATIGVLGATVSFFAAAGFAMTLLWRKKRPAVAAASADAAEGMRVPKAAAAADAAAGMQVPKAAAMADTATGTAVGMQVPKAAVMAVAAAGMRGPEPAASTDATVGTPAMEAAAPEETEVNGREEGKDHA